MQHRPTFICAEGYTTCLPFQFYGTLISDIPKPVLLKCWTCWWLVCCTSLQNHLQEKKGSPNWILMSPEKICRAVLGQHESLFPRVLLFPQVLPESQPHLNNLVKNNKKGKKNRSLLLFISKTSWIQSQNPGKLYKIRLIIYDVLLKTH